MYLTDSFQREVIHSSGGCESSKNKIKYMNFNWWIRSIGPNYCISEFKCNLNSNRFTSKRCIVFRVIIILYTIDLYVVLIPQSKSKWNKIVLIHTMSNLKIHCLPPIANTLRDLDMRFTWVWTPMIDSFSHIPRPYGTVVCNMCWWRHWDRCLQSMTRVVQINLKQRINSALNIEQMVISSKWIYKN